MTATATIEQISAIVGFTVTDAKFVSRHVKHPSCTYRGSTFEADDFTQWDLEVLRVRDQIESMDDDAGGGSIGGGSRELVLVLTDEDGEDHEFPEGEEWFTEIEKLLPAGTPCKRTVAELSAPVWDGNNHTEPNVETLAAMAGLGNSAFGHYSAGDYLADATIEDNETAESIVDDAEEIGVHLDLDEVSRYLAQTREPDAN